MLEVWLPLLGLLAIGATWFHVLRLREHVTVHARQLCERHGLQLLDDSVALHRLRTNWRNGALHVTREYRFETSRGGDDRQGASITLLGDRIVATRLPAREEFAGATPPAAGTFNAIAPPGAEAASGNVVSIDRARRNLH